MMETDHNVTFRRKDLPYVSFSALEDMRKKGELCDLTIKVQNCKFATHRVILAAGIPYFRTIFTRSGFGAQQKEICMRNLDPRAVESLIHYTYTSRIDVSKDNAQPLLLASAFLNMDEVKEVCVHFLSERLHFGNVVQVRELGLRSNSSKLLESCTIYIKKNFEEFSKSDNFLNLPYPYIQEIISTDDLNVSSEKVVFEAVMNWVKSSPRKDPSVLHLLLSEVRLTNLPPSYLTKKVASEEFIRISVPCTKLLENARNYNLLPTEESSLLNLKTRQRTNYIKNTMYTVCHSHEECSTYVFDFTNEIWRHLKSKKINKCIYGFAAVDDNIYMFLEETIQKFYPKTLQWKVLQTKHDNLEGSAILSYGTVIYCFGIVKSIFESAVHAFDARQNKWLMERKMMARHSSAAASLGDFIYVIGGIRNFSGYTKTSEKYNPLANTWCEIAPMLAYRASHSCAVIHDKIFACGGTTGHGYTDTAEVYNSVTNQWNIIASMFAKRSRLSLVSCNKKLYALGGCNETMKDSLETEIYDPESNKWFSSFSVPHGFQSALLVFMPQN